MQSFVAAAYYNMVGFVTAVVAFIARPLLPRVLQVTGEDTPDYIHTDRPCWNVASVTR